MPRDLVYQRGACDSRCLKLEIIPSTNSLNTRNPSNSIYCADRCSPYARSVASIPQRLCKIPQSHREAKSIPGRLCAWDSCLLKGDSAPLQAIMQQSAATEVACPTWREHQIGQVHAAIGGEPIASIFGGPGNGYSA